MGLENKDRFKILRQKMSEQPAKERIKNFNEVPNGYTEEQAVLEANRCLQCANPMCVTGCPIDIKIPEFIKLISERKFIEASKKIKETNPLPAICGRVCPQEEQCEVKCVINKKYKSVAIGRLERFAADYELENKTEDEVPDIESNNKKVAVVGSGPGGLVAAGELVLRGYQVTVFEGLHELGGVLVYGIPEFRLPKKIVSAEIDCLKKSGVVFEKNVVIGKTLTLPELFDKEKFSAVFLATGAGLPKFMKIEGENLLGVFSANEFLTRVNLMRAYKFPEYDTPIPEMKRVAVIGGGNVAMDAARVARRLGAEVYLIYRRSRDEMPARDEEIEHAIEEGIEFNLLCNPVRYIGDEEGYVKKVECIKMKLGEPDSSGRRSPVPIENSNFFIDIDAAVISIGNSSNPLLTSVTPGLKTTKLGTIIVDDKQLTTYKGVYAGGDCVTGGATVVLAAGSGRHAAISIDEYLSGNK